ncbi:MAG: hypothetical protein AB7P76_10020 [Candidatus Melainabacteria bacterium]
MSVPLTAMVHTAETVAKTGLMRRLAPSQLKQLPAFSKTWLKETITMMNSADPAIQRKATNRAVDMFYIVGFGSPLVNAIFNPPFMALKYKLGGMSNKDIKQQVGQEATVQLVGITSLGTAFFGLSQLAVMLMNRRFKNRPEVLEEFLRPVRSLAGNIGGALGFAFLRPLFGSIVFEKIYNRMKADDKAKAAAAAPATQKPVPLQKVGMMPQIQPISVPLARPGQPVTAATSVAVPAASPFTVSPPMPQTLQAPVFQPPVQGAGAAG